MINKKGFTIVELIVVISILATLATIGFLSYSGYLVGVRDTSRLSQLTSISEGLNILRTKGKLPIPDEKINLYYNNTGDIIAYQGIVGKNTLLNIEYSEDGLDPKDKTSYAYYLTANRKYFQVMGLLESSDSLAVGAVNNTYAAIDYSSRIPAVKGSKLGILTTDLNQPLAEYLLSGSLTEINIADVNNLPLKSYLTSNEYVTGTGTTFAELKNIAKVGGKYYTVVGNTFVYDVPTN